MSVPQQLVDAGFGASALVDPLDDDRAGKCGSAVRAGQSARNDHRIFGHATVMNFARGAVDDLGRSAEKYAHRQDRAALDHNALSDLWASAHEAIVLDNYR